MKTKRIAVTGLLVALAMILSYVESLIPPFAAVPGMKLRGRKKSRRVRRQLLLGASV